MNLQLPEVWRRSVVGAAILALWFAGLTGPGKCAVSTDGAVMAEDPAPPVQGLVPVAHRRAVLDEGTLAVDAGVILQRDQRSAQARGRMSAAEASARVAGVRALLARGIAELESRRADPALSIEAQRVVSMRLVRMRERFKELDGR